MQVVHAVISVYTRALLKCWSAASQRLVSEREQVNVEITEIIKITAAQKKKKEETSE